jgi:hypothetical protein
LLLVVVVVEDILPVAAPAVGFYQVRLGQYLVLHIISL